MKPKPGAARDPDADGMVRTRRVRIDPNDIRKDRYMIDVLTGEGGRWLTAAALDRFEARMCARYFRWAIKYALNRAKARGVGKGTR